MSASTPKGPEVEDAAPTVRRPPVDEDSGWDDPPEPARPSAPAAPAVAAADKAQQPASDPMPPASEGKDGSPARRKSRKTFKIPDDNVPSRPKVETSPEPPPVKIAPVAAAPPAPSPAPPAADAILQHLPPPAALPPTAASTPPADDVGEVIRPMRIINIGTVPPPPPADAESAVTKAEGPSFAAPPPPALAAPPPPPSAPTSDVEEVEAVEEVEVVPPPPPPRPPPPPPAAATLVSPPSSLGTPPPPPPAATTLVSPPSSLASPPPTAPPSLSSPLPPSPLATTLVSPPSSLASPPPPPPPTPAPGVAALSATLPVPEDGGAVAKPSSLAALTTTLPLPHDAKPAPPIPPPEVPVEVDVEPESEPEVPVDAAPADDAPREELDSLEEIEPEDRVSDVSKPTAAPPKPPPPPKRDGAPPSVQPASAPAATAPASAPAAATLDPLSLKKRQKPWWEEIFSDDYLRTMDRPDTKSMLRECNFIEERLGLEQGAVILDLGCGAGVHAVELASRGYSVVGYDLSLAMLARAADEAQSREQKLNFLHGDMREMAFEETFDGVYCWSTTFGYFDDDKNLDVLGRIHRALRKGGQLLLDVANRDYIAPRQPSLVWFEGEGCVCMDEMFVDFFASRLRVKRTVMFEDGRSKECDYAIRLYGLHELGKMLHECGFKVVEVTGHPAHPGVFFGSESPRIIVLAERS